MVKGQGRARAAVSSEHRALRRAGIRSGGNPTVYSGGGVSRASIRFLSVGLPLAALVMLAASGCRYQLPRENGVRWTCMGEVTDHNGNLVRTFPPANLWVCGNPDLDPDRVARSCVGFCERRLRNPRCFMTAEPTTRGCSRRRSGLVAQSLDEQLAGATTSDDELEEVSLLQGDPSSIEILLDPASQAHLDAGTHDGTTSLSSGRLRAFIDRQACDGSGRCRFLLTWLEAEAEDFTLERCLICREFDVEDVRLIFSGAPFEGTIDASGIFEFAEDTVWVEVSGVIGGDLFVIPIGDHEAFSGRLDPVTGEFEVKAKFSDGDGSVDFQLFGAVARRAPLAVIDGPAVAECGATETYSAERTTHPYGVIDSYVWQWSDAAGVGASSGIEIDVELPLGTHELFLEVTDTTGLLGEANMSIAVTDTIGPHIDAPEELHVEVCEGLQSISVPFLQAEDLCDGTLDVTAHLVEFNGLQVEWELGDSFELRPDETATIRYSSTDSSDNTTTVDQAVLTYRGASCCPDFPGKSRACHVGTPGDDTIDGGNGGDWIFGLPGDDLLIGGNGADVIYGGPGNDTIYGMNGADRLYGGAGDDQLYGGAGPDELEGGPGVDIMLGGDGADVFWIRAVCHAQPGEVIDGGPGRDTLYSPLTLEELAELGVEVSGIEVFVLIEDEGGCDV
jgi:hypothetical protein